MKTTLIFVYNADSGVFNTVTDIAHKIFSPKTYSCTLCAISHGYFKMHEEWKTFLESLDCPMEFLHRDELQKKYGIKNIALPAVFRKEHDALNVWLSAEDINQCKDMDALKKLIKSSKLQ